MFRRCTQVLSACELELGVPIRHSDLNRIDTIEDVVRHFEAEVARSEEATREAAAHWTLNLPPNVNIERPPPRPSYNVHPKDPRHYKHPRWRTGDAESGAEGGEEVEEGPGVQSPKPLVLLGRTASKKRSKL